MDTSNINISLKLVKLYSRRFDLEKLHICGNRKTTQLTESSELS